jgi:putative ABC transport system permease protein
VLKDPEISSGLRLKSITAGLGAFYGLLIAVPLVLNGFASMRARRRGRNWLLQVLRWLATLVIVPVLGALFGYYVPAIVILTITVILVGYLYIALWMVIWAVGGGRFREIFPGILVLLFPLFWPLIPVLIVLIIPTWTLGWLIQRFTFVDFKIAMRSMLATKGRGASTLVALVVGVFTLSLITMMVDTITQTFQNLLEDVAGGNILVLSAGGQDTMDDVRTVFDANPDYVRSYAIIANFDTRLTQYYDVSAGQEASRARSGAWYFGTVDGREITSNLPDLNFIAGRNLDPALDSAPDADGYWSIVAVKGQDETPPVDLGVGDRLVYSLPGGEVKFRIVGIGEQGLSFSDSNLYAPLPAFDGYKANSVFAIADVKEDHIRDIRRSLAQVPGAFVLETRLINDLLNRIIGQFTSFPILVAALALVTGGVVIANAVALSTLERRREIGVMKAIGLQRERVLGMLLLENGLMGIVGGLIGVGIGFVGLVISLTRSDLGSNTAIPYGTAFALMGLCILISLGAALLSVWGASGEKPLNVLRYE